MRYGKFILTIFVITLLIFTVSGCQINSPDPQETEKQDSSELTEEKSSQKIQIVTSISIIADLVEQVVGDYGEIDYIVGLGEEPEEFEPKPSDFQAINDADIFFINGYNLETWLEQVASNVTDTKIVAIAETGDTISLEGTDIPDPHLWLDPIKVKEHYIVDIMKTLVKIDRENEEFYRKSAEDYQQKLIKLDEELREELAEIPDKHRFIVNIENCFKYYGESYGLETYGIWEINAHEEGTPQQFAKIIDLVKDEHIPALFVESTIDPRYMERVAEETGTEIAGKVYTDALGNEESGADNYLDMMRHNTRVITEGLTSQ